MSEIGSMQLARNELGNGIATLAITGSVHCGAECSLLEREVDSLMQEKQTRLILDLSSVSTMDSAAIGSVVRCFRKLKAVGGDLRLAAAPPLITRILDQTKVNKIVPTFPTVSEAAASFSAST
jgi:anti-sigma B factor antagonist